MFIERNIGDQLILLLYSPLNYQVGRIPLCLIIIDKLKVGSRVFKVKLCLKPFSNILKCL